MQQRSPARLFALIFGIVLVVVGVLGFFYDASFSTGEATLTDRDAVLGLLDVNGWHNVVHLSSGLVGLAATGSYSSSRLYALGLGGLYVLITILGFIVGDGDSLLKLIPVNTGDNILHALIATAGIGAGFATPPEPAPTTTAG